MKIPNKIIGAAILLLLGGMAVAVGTVYAPTLTLKSTTGSINFQATGDVDDYITFATPADIPRISVSGGAILEITENVLPDTNDSKDLGSTAQRWQNGYFANAIDVGDIAFNNGMRLIEAEKLTNNKIQGLVWLNSDGDAIMYLNPNGNLKVKGTIEENWAGIPDTFSFDDNGGVYYNNKVVKYPTVENKLDPEYIDNLEEINAPNYFNTPQKPPTYT